MDTTIIASLIGVAGGLIGAWIGGNISRKASMEAVESANKNTIDLLRKQELYRDYSEFKGAFTSELAFLISDIKPDSSIHGTTYDILTKALNKHKAAVDALVRSLPEEKRGGFNEVWEEYLHPNNDNKDPSFALDSYEGGDDFEKRKLAHSNISKLLEVAKPK